MPFCESFNSIGRGVTKIPPPRTPPNSHYQYDYSNYNFDVVTLEVRMSIVT